jgi:hypothetical protein
MKDHWFDLLKRLDYKSGQTIIDIGGAMDPVPIADVVVDLIDLGKGGKSYTKLDVCTQPLPFENKSFDIAICCQTLEDLFCPTLILAEMQRVAKRGIIQSPHRGPESLKNTYYECRRQPHSMDEIWHFGTEHHKWLIEEKDGYLWFTPKVQYMLMVHPIPQWRGPGGIDHMWENNIKAKVFYDIDEFGTLDNYKIFREDNRQFWE